MTFPKISLAAARVNAGYSQDVAAKALGVCRETLIRYESGDSVPTWDKVKQIEKLYQFPADYIFFGKRDR